MDDKYYHQKSLDIISFFSRRKKGILIKKNHRFDKIRADLVPAKKGFALTFTFDWITHRKFVDVGNTYKKLSFKIKEQQVVFEDIFINTLSGKTISASIDFLYSSGYSKTKKYYYRLIIPLKKEIRFHYQVDEFAYATDLGYRTRNATRATVNGETIEALIIHDKDKNYFLSIESSIRENYEEFSKRAFALKNALGYMTGYLAGDHGFFMAYATKLKDTPLHYYHCGFRDTINSSYVPIHSNPYTFTAIRRNKADKIYKGKLLRALSFDELSLLSQKLFESEDFNSALMLIMESSVGTLLSMPGGFAIALESLSDIILGDTVERISPIKDKTVARQFIKDCKQLIDNFSREIDHQGRMVLHGKMEHINQPTNKARLRAPFDLLNIKLVQYDLDILQSRNDFLHGRIPDIRKLGIDRSLDIKNRDLYYASMRFMTLLNKLILKWIGFDNYIINHPQISEPFCQFKLKEEPFLFIGKTK